MKGAALAIPAAAAAAYFLFAGKSHAAKPKPVPSPTSMPVPERMARVLATRNPAAIRFEAGRLRQEGYPKEAAELERAAAAIEAGQVTTPAPAPVLTLPVPVPIPVVAQVPGLPPIVAPTPVPTSPATVAIPGAPWLSGVPAQLQGVVLRKVPPPAPYDARVLLVQQRLLALGYKLPSGADGKFGSETEAAVKAFQSSNGVTPLDGIVGPATLSALASPTAKGPGAKPPAPVKPPPATPIVKPPPAPAPVKPPIPLPAGPAPAPAPASSTGTAPTITPALRSLPALLRNGKPTYKAPASSGQAVKDWQQVLFDLGFLKAKPDGKFGDATEAATRAFQTAANSAAAKSGKPQLKVDGIVGPATVSRASEARVMRSGPATFTGDVAYFGDDVMFAPARPLADSPLPGYVPPMQPSGPDPARALASRLLHNLVSSPAGREDRMLVQLFQQAEGLRPTGYYGPATALVLAQRYGIVPPKPIHWTESRTSRSKANYRDALRMLGERDPQRAEEWFRASEV